jgi:type IV pilus assembly protein PilY1
MGNVASSGTSSNSLATSPICITLPNGVETCKSNTSDASILEVERDAGVLLGRWMWREL